MSDDFFMDRVYRAFDKDSDGYLSHEEWVVGLSTFIKGDLNSAIECEPMNIIIIPFHTLTHYKH